METLLSRKTRDAREARRLRAWELSQSGWTQTAIAQALGVTQGAVSQWLKRATNEGVDGLKARPIRGPRSRLSPEQLRQLPGLLEQGAEAFGFRGQVWTRGRIVVVIHQTFGVRYTPQRVGQLLRLLGWTLQKPKRKARQQDPAKVAAFLQERWPELKRGPLRTTGR